MKLGRKRQKHEKLNPEWLVLVDVLMELEKQSRRSGWSDDFPKTCYVVIARTKLGSDPVEVATGKWQYRAKPGDVADRHNPLEELNPQTGEVIQNLHLRRPEGGDR